MAATWVYTTYYLYSLKKKREKQTTADYKKVYDESANTKEPQLSHKTRIKQEVYILSVWPNVTFIWNMHSVSSLFHRYYSQNSDPLK